MKRYLLTAVMILTVASGLSAASVAVDGLALLRIEHGARAAGMGATFTYNSWDPNVAAYNPAAAAGLKQFAASFGHTEYWDNIRLESGYAWSNLNDRIGVHFGIRHATVSDIEARTGPSEEPIGTFDAEETSIKGGVSVEITPRIAAGIGLGWYIEKIDIYNGAGFNADLGVIYVPVDEVTLGASVTSLGSDFSLSEGGLASEDIPLPTTYRIGGSYYYDFVTGAADLVIVNDDAHLHVGFDAALDELFSLRAGYMSGYDSKDFTAGASFTPDKLRIDYAFLPFKNNLGTSHMFTLSFKL